MSDKVAVRRDDIVRINLHAAIDQQRVMYPDDVETV